MKILPYKPGSRSARLLSQSTGALRLKTSSTRTRWAPSITGRSVVLNWGHSGEPWPFRWGVNDVRWINRPSCVRQASNKLETAQVFNEEGVSQPEWTTSVDQARWWLDEGKTVLARTLLRASSGRGIIKIEPGTLDIPAAPLYTVYVPKQSEWRVHVWGDSVFHIQRKIARPDSEPTDWQIRNHDNGFIFQQDYDVTKWHQRIADEAIKAVEALGLDFGAVDVIHNEYCQRAYVLEVNTAPGLEGRTLEKYVERIRDYGGL